MTSSYRTETSDSREQLSSPGGAMRARCISPRRCLSEIETLPHILGFCPYSEALRNIRHHAVRSMLAEALKEVGFTVHQEVQGLATQGSVRRIDIIAIKNNSAYILDSTIRFETHADNRMRWTVKRNGSMNQQSRSIKINIACPTLI
ncbi:hypothetical protein ANN_02578 [Periplaneta americana]|uniref:Uncharacterized protein n=1 Tax=Periplaneta americana TaxID=6978 RepID=A0ABQ8TWP1_PERAM|nr:hypothetical protein ANN_02578 [Periplaneta americana]